MFIPGPLRSSAREGSPGAWSCVFSQSYIPEAVPTHLEDVESHSPAHPLDAVSGPQEALRELALLAALRAGSAVQQPGFCPGSHVNTGREERPRPFPNRVGQGLEARVHLLLLP